MASTWSDSVIVERSASADSRPGSVSAVTSYPSARRAETTSSHAHAPSQNPAARIIGAEGVGQPYRPHRHDWPPGWGFRALLPADQAAGEGEEAFVNVVTAVGAYQETAAVVQLHTSLPDETTVLVVVVTAVSD